MHSPKVILSFSAGPDSVYLFHYLKKEISAENIILIYFDHRLRAKAEIAKEIALTKKVGQENVCQVIIEKLDVQEYAESNKYSVEFAARELRRKALIENAKKFKVVKIYMAHHLDDQCETFFHKLIRGAKTNLGAMKPKVNLADDIYIHRPLLEIRKQEILAYLRENKINYCLDKSNEENLYTRNIIRNKLLPVVEQINSNYRGQISSYLTYLEEQNDFLRSMVFPIWQKVKRVQDRFSLAKKDILAQHPFIQKQVIFYLINEFAGYDCKIATSQIEAVCELLAKDEFKIVELPQGFLCLIDQEKVVVMKKEDFKVKDYEYKVKEIPIEIYIEEIGKTVVLELQKKEAKMDKKLRFFCKNEEKRAVLLNLKALDLQALVVRNRRAGDRVKAPGRQFHKKLKKYFIDEKISKLDRDMLPLLVNGGIVVGFATP
jgi:tRNA(Ile)-lysidine synthase